MERAPEELLPPRPLATTIKVLDSFGDWVGTTVAFLVVPLMATLVYDATSRYFFNRPIGWAFPITFMLTGGMFMLGAGYVLLKKNISAPISSTSDSPCGGRGLWTPRYTRSSSSRG